MKYFILLCSFILGLQACSHEDSSSKKELITLQKAASANILFYSGIIQPLKSVVVSTPAEGIVMEMPFQYGDKVKAGQLLFQLSSSKFLSDYKTALMQYVKAKSDFNTSQSQLSEAVFLHRNQLISDDDFKMKQSGFYSARLALLQAKDVLENLLHQLSIQEADLYKLSIADIDKITQALHFESDSEKLRILSPVNGMVLAPNKSEDEIKKISKGEAVKQNDVLAVIGDMSGLTIHVKVNELSVNQLKIGQKVKVTGMAFEDVLNGKINRIDQQGELTNGGIPSFSVEIIVPELTKKQQADIHVGMSAKVEIDIEEAPQIIIPIAAVHEKNGEPQVQRYDEKSKKYQDVTIKTGNTTLDSVTVIAGLSEGDKIVLPH